MRTPFLVLASVLALSLTSSTWAASSASPAGAAAPLVRPVRADLSAAGPVELEMRGELRFYRHIDPITGRGAVSLHVGEQDIPLDFRQFDMDILLRAGPHVIKGHWGKQKRLIVTEAHPARRS